MEKYLKWVILIVSGQFLCILSFMTKAIGLASILKILGVSLGLMGMAMTFIDWIKRYRK